MSKTQEALSEIKKAAERGEQMITPCIFSHVFGRAAASAAFRMARAQGVIEVAYTSVVGTPVYRAAGVGAAVVEAATAAKN